MITAAAAAAEGLVEAVEARRGEAARRRGGGRREAGRGRGGGHVGI